MGYRRLASQKARKAPQEAGVGEWGIRRLPGQSAAQADDPVYMDNMYRFFRNSAADIAYETYFDGNTGVGSSSICPGNQFPKAAAMYGHDWGQGN